MIRWLAIAGIAYTIALAIVSLRLRHFELKVAMLQARMDAPKVEPIDLRSDYGTVERGGPAGGYAVVRRIGDSQDEIVTAGAFLGEGQYVQIRGEVAYPTPYPGD